MRRIILPLTGAVCVLAGMMLSVPSAAAQSADCDNCSDHPLVSRYPKSALVGHDLKAFENQTYVVGPVTVNEDREKQPPKTMAVSGRSTRLFYLEPEGRSGLEVFENYKQALTKAGMTTVWSCSGDEACGPGFDSAVVDKMRLDLGNTTEARQGIADGSEARYVLAKLARPQGDVYVAVLATDLEFHTPKRAGAFVVVLEAKAMDSGMVTMDASALDTSLTSTGKAVVYGIYFDVDKTAVKAESKPQLEAIAKVLAQHPDLKLNVVGHTDSQGAAAHNQKLSQGRADAIVATLVRDYSVAADRLTPQGVGSTQPVASNATEDGRAKNRRVELVKR